MNKYSIDRIKRRDTVTWITVEIGKIWARIRAQRIELPFDTSF
jgi:hypothetical protein